MSCLHKANEFILFHSITIDHKIILLCDGQIDCFDHTPVHYLKCINIIMYTHDKKMRNLGAHNFYLHLKENDRKNVEIAHNNTTFIMNW